MIRFTHASSAAPEIARSISFYTSLFLQYSKKTWPEVLSTARIFDTEIRSKWPRYHEELRGIADGSKCEILDIVAINVRSEIAFGLFSDGCTSLFWDSTATDAGADKVFLGQNWDWMEQQKQNLIVLSIYQQELPTIKMVTEAGILGKIGLNSAGVGVCFNAIRAVGLDTSRMPCHLGLRIALESTSALSAVQELEAAGMAASAHILIGDSSGDAIGLEFTSETFARLEKSERGTIGHSNHLIGSHEGVSEPVWLEDSVPRLDKMMTLVESVGDRAPTWTDFEGFFENQDGYPASICRTQKGTSTVATLFNIVMDLKSKRAVVKLGKPCEVEEVVELSFQ